MPRQPRLGDILDDYCPRERRITNHAVVAMIDQQIRRTRCTTCDAEHEYREARIPVRRKKKDADPAGAIYAEESLAPDSAKPEARVEAEVEAEAETDTPPADAGDREEDDARVHRPLIRATLPRIEGQAPGRPAPEFTVRQPHLGGGGRGGGFRDAGRGSQRGPRRGAAPKAGHAQGHGSHARPHQPHSTRRPDTRHGPHGQSGRREKKRSR